MLLQLTVLGAAGPVDIGLEVREDVPLADVLPQLFACAGESFDDTTPVLLDGRSIETSGLVGALLLDGMCVAQGTPGVVLEGAYECRVVGGADAGAVFALAPGRTVVGRSRSSDLFIDDQDVSRQHAALAVDDLGVSVEDLGSLNGTLVDGDFLAGARSLVGGELLRVGDTLLAIAPRTTSDAAVTAAPGRRDYNRPPRLAPAETAVRLVEPQAPKEPQRRGPPYLTILVPLLFSLVLAYVTRNALYLLFAGMGPLLILSTYFSDKRSGKRSFGQEVAEHQTRTLALKEELATALDAEVVARRGAHPDVATIGLIATTPLSRLWERRAHDEDMLAVRLGTGSLPAAVTVVETVDGREHATNPVLDDVPVAVDLREAGVLGMAGPTASVRAAARGLLCQLAVLVSPRDLDLVLLCPPESEADWGFFRWLPHAQGADDQLRIGHDAETTRRRVGELAALVETRRAAARDSRTTAADFHPAVVVVLDGARRLRTVPGLAGVLQHGPSVGVHLVCLDQQERLLPAECQAVVLHPEKGSGEVTVRRAHAQTLLGVLGDGVSPVWAERTARALAPVRDVTPEEQGASLAQSVRLLDLLGLDPPTADAVGARWLLSPRSTSATVGVTTDGPFSLDLRRDGPHGLVAGTTGAGKSELLQTVIASLAVSNRPDALTFVLVDYKGGSAFKDCARLPHTVGLVTDLDGHLVERALSSLGAELKRRETVLAAAGTKDVEDYVDAGSPGGPLPRLLLVIDEFASLVEELPDFVRGLVGIAQRGRSLGVHLLLATQRPSGVVSPEIRANTNLRIALRVTDPAESLDVIDSQEAAALPRSAPGRAYVRTGHTSLSMVQSARVGGRPPAEVDERQASVQALPWSALGSPLPRPVEQAREQDDETDLRRLVDALREAFARTGAPAPRRPWLPALPSQLLLDQLGTTSTLDAVVFGLEDHPAVQAQLPATLDVVGGSHLLVAGAARSGRSTVLRTLVAGLVDAAGADDLHLYGLDCGNGALLPLRQLPHCGAVVQRTEEERADRLLQRLAQEVAHRQERLSEAGLADIREQRAAAGADGMPYLVLLIDRWEGFLASFDEIDAGRLTDTVYRLLREGPGVGLRVVITGDRSLLTGRVVTLVEDKLLLRMADRGDYALGGIAPRSVPDDVPPGQAFRSDSGTQVQVALLDPAVEAAAQARALLARPSALVQRSEGRPGPFRVDVLPARLGLAAARALAALPASPLSLLAGVGGDQLEGITLDLDELGPGYTVAGPARSGRSTALLVAALGFLEVGTRVVALTPRPSPLRVLRDRPGATVLLDEPSPEELVEVLNAEEGPLALLLDDAELLHGSELQPLLQQVLREGRDMTHCVLVAGTTEDLAQAFRGFLADARRSRTGLLLSPDSHQHGEMLGHRLPRSAVFQGPPGRGLLLRRGRVDLVQVPFPEQA